MKYTKINIMISSMMEGRDVEWVEWVFYVILHVLNNKKYNTIISYFNYNKILAWKKSRW